MYSHILPLDSSKTAEKGLPYARHLAGKLKIPVELLAVLDIAEMKTRQRAHRNTPGRRRLPYCRSHREASGRIEYGDLAHPEIDDLLDDAGGLVARRDGQIVIVPAESMPTQTGVAAIYRF